MSSSEFEPGLERLSAAYEAGGVKALKAEAARLSAPGWLEGTDDSLGWDADLVAACGEPRYQVPATWLLLERAKKGAFLHRAQVEHLGDRLKSLEAPHAQLHACQLVRFLDVPPAAADRFAAFLRSGLSSQRPFVRAWAIDGLVHLARQHEGLASEAREALEAGAEDPAPSVRARVRHL